MFNRILVTCSAVILVGVVAAAQAPATPQVDTATTGNAQRGKALYESFSCYACHGFDAQTGNGARLLPSRMSQQVFTAYIRAPKQMPPYTAKILFDAQAADIYAYIQTLPKAPEAKDIPLLSQLP
jgi:mono/diheme cytochrome c family protein